MHVFSTSQLRAKEMGINHRCVAVMSDMAVLFNIKISQVSPTRPKHP